MKVAITGATGFIGRELVFKHLECGNSVKILTRKNKDQLTFPVEVQVVNGDLSDAGDSLPSFVKGVDVLYHCAAEILDESKMFKINVIGTQNLVNASTGIIKHWVQLSSTGVYGKIKSGLITERIHPYPYNQATQEQPCQHNFRISPDRPFAPSLLTNRGSRYPKCNASSV